MSSRAEPGTLAYWAEGPVRWLLLPWEVRELRRLEKGRKAMLFIDEFWHRRDPNPSESDNPRLETFRERVEAADYIYGTDEVRGSLADRGRALILLGPPPILRTSVRKIPRIDLRGSEATRRRAVREQRVEVWEYPWDELSPALQEHLGPDVADQPQVLTFVVGRNKTFLTDGERLLVLAAESLVISPPSKARRRSGL